MQSTLNQFFWLSKLVKQQNNLYLRKRLLHLLSQEVFHAIFHLTKVAIGPGLSHSGFHKLSVGNESTVNTKHYLHYLHHRYFECNYGAGLDGAILPLDKWVGTFHDGSNEAQERMVNKLRESD